MPLTTEQINNLGNTSIINDPEQSSTSLTADQIDALSEANLGNVGYQSKNLGLDPS